MKIIRLSGVSNREILNTLQIFTKNVEVRLSKMESVLVNLDLKLSNIEAEIVDV